MRTALCLASLQTSLRSRYIPRYRPNPSPGQRPPLFAAAWLCVGSCNLQAGAAEAYFAYCACTEELRLSSGSCCSSLFCATFVYWYWYLSRTVFLLQTCVTRTSVTDLRNKIRGASRATDPQKMIAISDHGNFYHSVCAFWTCLALAGL